MKKKTTKRNFRKLPKYALGTMKPYYDKGYQEASGIGSALFTTQPGISLDPETLAIKQNTIPKALNYALMQAPYLTLIAKNNTKTTTLSAANNISTNSTLSNGFVPSTVSTGYQGSLGSFANGAIVGGGLSLLPSALTNATGGAVSDIALNTAKDIIAPITIDATEKAINGANITWQSFNAAKQKIAEESAKRIGGLSAAGKALGIVGSAIGAATMASLIADFDSHRTGSDMMLNVGRQQYTTDYGNTYQNYTGVNSNQELAYERANARSKQLGFGVNSIGTGASIGGTIGGPIGMGIGALAGLVLGGLGSLFGWGDNEEEVKRLILLTNDNIAMYNRELASVAKSKDVAAEFNNRIATASEGKESFGPMLTKSGDNTNTPRFIFDVNARNKVGVGIPMSKLMPKETVLDKETGNWARVPGKGKKDNIYSNVAPGDSHVVFTNKNGISDLAAGVLKSNAPEKLKLWQLNELENMLADLRAAEEGLKEMNKYKCGKLPGYEGGTPWLDYAFPASSGLFSLIGLNSERNRVKNATFPMYPSVPENAGATKAIDILGNRRFNADPILNQLHNTYRQSLYDINRMPGLGAGGLTIARANAAHQKNKQAAEVLAKADEVNNQYIADYANAIRDYGNRMQDLMVANNAQRMALWQQQNAAKENWLAENAHSISNVIGALSKDLLGANQFHRAQDYQDRMLKLYGDNLDIEKTKVSNEWLQNQELMRFRREQADRESAERAAASKPSPIIYQDYWYPGMDLEKAFSRNKLYIPRFNFSLG